LRKELEVAAKELERRDREERIGMDAGPGIVFKDSADEPVRWW